MILRNDELNPSTGSVIQGTGQYWKAVPQTANFYNAKVWGAVGDGVTDDTAALQSVLNAAYAAGGGTVYLPTGHYMIRYKLVLQTGCRLTGNGYSSQIISNVTVGYNDPEEGNDTHPTVEVPTNHYGTCFDHIRVTATPGADSRIYGWHGRPASYQNWVHHCWFENFTGTLLGAIDPSNSYDNIIEANICTNCVVGISLTGTSGQYGNQVTDNKVTGAVIALNMEYPWKAVISGNHLEGSSSAIVQMGTWQAQGNPVNGQVIISNNVLVCTGTVQAGVIFGHNVTYGITTNVIFSGNSLIVTAAGNSSDALQCQGVINCIFANNFIWAGAGQTSAFGFRGADVGNLVTGNFLQKGLYGVNFSGGGAAVNNTVSGNVFQSETYGVYISASGTVAVGTLIDGNRFMSTVTTPITNNGTNTVVTSNVSGVVSLANNGPIGVNGSNPPAKASTPGNATGTDAAVINALTTILQNLGFCA